MFREQDLWCNLNLSVPADEILIGRPFWWSWICMSKVETLYDKRNTP